MPSAFFLPVLPIDTLAGANVVSKVDYLTTTYSIDSNEHDLPAQSGTFPIRGRGETTWLLPKEAVQDQAVVGAGDAGDARVQGLGSDREPHRRLADPRCRGIRCLRDAPGGASVDTTQRVLRGDPQRHVHRRLPGDRDGQGGSDAHQSDPGQGDRPGRPCGDWRLLARGRPAGVTEEAENPATGFKTTRGVPFIYDDPGELAAEQSAYIKTFIQAAKNALFADGFDNPTGWRTKLDEQLFIDWYLVNELLKNAGADFFSSCKCYKVRDTADTPGKLHAVGLRRFRVSGLDHRWPHRRARLGGLAHPHRILAPATVPRCRVQPEGRRAVRAVVAATKEATRTASTSSEIGCYANWLRRVRQRATLGQGERDHPER